MMSQRQAVRIDAHPHPQQAAVHVHSARFKLLACGRRWGKTRLGVNECLDVASHGGRAWWVAPSYKMSEVGWRPLRQIATRIGAEVRRVDHQIILPGGGEVTVRSADNPDALRGEGLDYVVVDECAFVPEAAWTEALRPALSDRLGRAMFISTPKGRNWFWRLWERGQDANDDEWASWQFPTSGNPYIAASEIEAARLGLPERVFLQEYEAQFLDDAGGVFRRVADAATAIECEPEEGHEYCMGVDWGKSNDYTVLTVMDIAERRMVAMDRFNRIDYTVQRGRLEAMAGRYNPSVILAESNSMGEPIIEQLQRDGLPVRGFTTTNATKAQAIEALALAFERGDISILNDPVLVGELQAYEMERLPSGMVRYGAPEGMHDDTVMSLALAWQAIETSGPLLLWGN
jgi:phage terminase large subunit-like protein